MAGVGGGTTRGYAHIEEQQGRQPMREGERENTEMPHRHFKQLENGHFWGKEGEDACRSRVRLSNNVNELNAKARQHITRRRARHLPHSRKACTCRVSGVDDERRQKGQRMSRPLPFQAHPEHLTTHTHRQTHAHRLALTSKKRKSRDRRKKKKSQVRDGKRKATELRNRAEFILLVLPVNVPRNLLERLAPLLLCRRMRFPLAKL